jgi:hypothetical protein
MILNQLDISKSLYYPAGGTDVQCIMRFSHITKTVIAPTVSEYLTLNKYSEQFSIKCDTINEHFDEKVISFDGVVEEDAGLITRNKYIPFPSGVFSEAEKKIYMQAFNHHIHSEPRVYRFMFTRMIGRTKRKIEWIAMTTEGLATLMTLFKFTHQYPEIICTIQSGILEYPGSMFVRLIDELKPNTRIWIRGYWPCCDQSRTAISDFEPYSVAIQDYGHWYSPLGVAPEAGEENPGTPPLSYVRAFTNNIDFLDTIPKEKVLIHPTNNNRKITIKLGSIKEAVNGFDHIITSRRIIEEDGDKVVNWESLSNNPESKLFPCFTFKQSIYKLKEFFGKEGIRSIAISPIGFEDESVYLLEFLQESNKDMDLTIFHVRPLDFYDLKVGTYMQYYD